MTFRSSLAVILFLSLVPSLGNAAPVTLDFDSVALAPEGCTDASAYLGAFGITFVSVSGGASPVICNTTGTVITASSLPNVFFGLPAVTNTDESYDLLFSTPLDFLSFTRATVAAHTSLPPWSAFAFDASDTLLDFVVEPAIFPGPTAAVFTLDGPGIVRLRVNAFNSASTTFNHPPFDDMILGIPDVAEIPEPASLLLIGSGLTAAALRRRSAKRTNHTLRNR